MRFRDLGFPTPKTEDWRFTNVGPLLKIPFEPAPLAQVEAKCLPALPTPGTIRLTFVNGVYAADLSSANQGLRGVQIGSLAAVSAEQAGKLQKVLGLADYQGQVFTALNTSFLQDGAYVVVADGMVVAEPIELVYLSVPGGNTTVTYPRTVVVAGKNSQVTIAEHYLEGPAKGTYFTNAVTEIVLAEHAVVDHYKVQKEGREAYHIATTQIAQAAGSQFSTHFLSLGGELVRNEVLVRFDGEGCEATVNGLYLADGKQHIDNYTVIDHAKPRCNSHELYKGILNDRRMAYLTARFMSVRMRKRPTPSKQTRCCSCRTAPPSIPNPSSRYSRTMSNAPMAPPWANSMPNRSFICEAGESVWKRPASC